MTDRRSVLFFAVTGLLFGGTFVGAKAGLAYFPPLLFVALRFDVAAVALAGYVLATRSREELVPRTRADVLGILATGLVAIGLTNALIFVGQQHVTSGVASIIASLNPILTPVFAALLLPDERLSARGAAGMTLGLLGVAMIVNPDPANLLGGSGFGKVVMFGAAVSGAFGSVLIRRADDDMTSSVRTAWGLPLGALLGHALSLSAGESVANVTWTREAVLALAFVGLFAGGVAYITYFGLLDSAGAIKSNLVFYVTPVVAAVGGWALLDETITPLAVAGFLTITVGFAVIGSRSVDLSAVRPAPVSDGGAGEEDAETREVSGCGAD